MANPWVGGGGAYRDWEVLKRWTTHFETIKLFVGYYPGAKRTIQNGVEIIPIGFGKNEIVSRLSYNVYANLEILKHLGEPMGLSLSPYAALFAARLNRPKTYGVLHHIIGDTWKKKVPVIGNLLKQYEMRYFLSFSHYISVNSKIANDFQNLNPKLKILVSANGFDEKLLETNDNSDPTTPKVLFIGRLDIVMKGLDFLVLAILELRVKFPKLKLVIAGRGDALSEKQLINIAGTSSQEFLSIKTNITNSERQKLLSQCWIFSSPSRFEGWGISSVEANAAGKPVVVSEASGFQNSISQGYSGIRVPIGDHKALVQALDELLSHPKKRKQMGHQARIWAKRFTWDSIAEKEYKWIQKIFQDYHE